MKVKNNFIVWFLTSGFYALQMTLRVLPAIMIESFTEKFSMNAEQFGLLAGFYYVGYAAAQIPVGLLLDRFHPRIVIFSCIMLCVAGIYLMIYSENHLALYVSRILIGAGSAGGILGAVKAIDDFFPRRYSIMLGFTVFLGVSGAYYGGEPVRLLLESYSEIQVLNYIAYVAMALACAVLITYNRSHAEDKSLEDEALSSSLIHCLADKRFWLIGIFAGLMVGPLGGFADFWGNRYFIQVHHLTNEQASFAATLIFLGLGIGSPIMGFVSAKVKSLAKLIALTGVIQVMLTFSLFFLNPSREIIYLICLLIGVLCAYQIIVFSLATKIARSHEVGIITSLVNMLIMIFGFVFHSLIGFSLKNFFTAISTEELVYDNLAYSKSFSIIIIGIIISTVGFYFYISRFERHRAK